MTSEERVLKREEERGRANAQAVQNRSAEMTGTELNAAEGDIPRFAEAVKQKNMMERKAGMTDGFVCKSTAGRVVRLIQNYDSDVFTGEPEELPAQWGFVWSDNPEHAKEFVAISTSPFMKGNCCRENGEVYRSAIDNNVWSPSDYPEGWEKVKGW